MTENLEDMKVSEERKDKKIEKQGIHLSKKNIGILVGIFGLLVILLSSVNLKPKIKEQEKQGYEEKMSVSDVTDLPTSYEDLNASKESYEYAYEENTYQDQNSYYQESSREDEERRRELEKLEQESELARRSGIGFSANNKNYGQNTSNSNGNRNTPPQDYDLNRQDSKKNFLKNEEANPNYLGNYEEYPVSPYEVKAGTIIPGVMITGINSDLPGNIVGQVRETVFDTVSGNHILIPQGTKIFGSYDSNVTWGQERALIVWQRLIFPNGKSINLSNMPGVDLTGQAGFKDKVNNHFGSLLKGVLLTSIAGAGAAIVTEDNDSDDNDTDYASEAGKAAGIAVINIGNKFAEKALDRQPTIEIRPGYRFNIMVHRDMILTPYK